MNKLLRDNFEKLAASSNGIAKLRELILQLAAQGKLVGQDPHDEPASTLLEKIKSRKEKLIKQGKIKKRKLLLPVEPDERPYKLPETWIWTRLGEVVNYSGADKCASEEIPTDAWLLELGDIEKDTSRILKRLMYGDRLAKSTKARFYKDDVLYSKLRPYLNKVVVADSDGYCTTEILPLRGFYKLFPKYLMYALKRPDFITHVNSLAYGVKMPRLGTDDGRSSLFPLPPFPEQKRIVARIDELMVLCDEFEEKQRQRGSKLVAVNDSAVDHMLAAKTAAEFKKHFKLIFENFDTLYDNSGNVKKLHQAILQLAVQGKLVPQNPKDEPASKLLKKIKVEKENLLKEGKIKKQKQLPPIEPDELPYDLPKGWNWTRIDFVSNKVEYGTSQKASPVPKGVPVLRMGNIQGGGIEYSGLKYVSEDIEDLPRLYLQQNDILFNRTNSYELVGKTGIYKGDAEKYTFASYLIRVVLQSGADPDYVNYAINSRYFRETQIEPEITQQCGQANFNGTKLRHSLIPLPPTKEQKRIVKKVDELMSLCNELEKQITESQSKSENLMSAVVHNLLSCS